MDYSPWGQKIETAQNIHASRGGCEIHANQFWWVWPLWFQRFSPFFVCHQNGQNFLRTMDYNGGQKIELAQKNYASRG